MSAEMSVEDDCRALKLLFVAVIVRQLMCYNIKSCLPRG